MIVLICSTLYVSLKSNKALLSILFYLNPSASSVNKNIGVILIISYFLLTGPSKDMVKLFKVINCVALIIKMSQSILLKSLII